MPFESNLTSISFDGALIADTLSSTKLMKTPGFREYVSHWGMISPYNWKPRRQQWSFNGNEHKHIEDMTLSNNANKHVFCCVTKIITVMLFLRLEELGLLSMNDTICGLPHKVTWQ